jgi:hypothetical protein
MTFQEIKINQKFYASNGTPSIKLSQDKARSLVPELVSPCTNGYVENYEFKVKPNERVYL